MAELIAYAARTGTARNLAGLRALGWRLLVSASGVHRTEGFEDLGIALDNGAWSVRDLGCYPDHPDHLKRLFIRLVLAFGAVADWAVPPDIVAGGGASLALSLRWMAWVLKLWAPLHDLLDHRVLNQVPGLDVPSTENLAGWLECKRSCSSSRRVTVSAPMRSSKHGLSDRRSASTSQGSARAPPSCSPSVTSSRCTRSAFITPSRCSGG